MFTSQHCYQAIKRNSDINLKQWKSPLADYKADVSLHLKILQSDL